MTISRRRFNSVLENNFRRLGLVALSLASVVLMKECILECYYVPSDSMEQSILRGEHILVAKCAYSFRLSGRIPLTNLHFPEVLLWRSGHLERGDVVVFRKPGAEKRDTYFVKRVIALAGDTIECSDSLLLVNGNRLKSSDGSFVTSDGFLGTRPIRIPQKGDTVALTSEISGQCQRLIWIEGHRLFIRHAQEILVDGKPQLDYVVESNYCFVLGDNTQGSLDSREFGFISQESIVGQALVVAWSCEPSENNSNDHPRESGTRWGRILSFIH